MVVTKQDSRSLDYDSYSLEVRRLGDDMVVSDCRDPAIRGLIIERNTVRGMSVVVPCN